MSDGFDDLRAALLTRSNFAWANLTRARFSGAIIRDANFTGARLDEANLKYADLANACLERANLARADLAFANLSHANLVGANLACANLESVELTGAVITSTGLIDGGEERRGYRFWASRRSDGCVVYHAGCRTWSDLDDAIAYFGDSYRGKGDRTECIARLRLLELCARQRGWIKVTSTPND